MKRRHWWLPLTIFALVVAVDWVRLHEAGVATQAEARHLFLLISVAVTGSLVIKIVFSRAWPLQELGHLGVLAGLVGLALRVLGRYGPQPVSEHERDIIQALLDVGAVALLLGMILWVIVHGRKGETGVNVPPPAIERDEVTGVIHPATEVIFDRRQGPRRHGFGRRKDDRQP